MKNVVLNGQKLTISEVISVAYHYHHVEIDKNALKAVRKSRNYVEKLVQNQEVVYGITTGFGSNASKVITDYEEARLMQRNLLLSHACGVGKPFETPIVRAIMLIRLNTLLAGFSGAREETITLLKNLINEKIHPIIPSQGSVGASGDLCPLSHMALVLIGEGLAEVDGEILSGAKVLTIKKLEKIELQHKEGIALLNGTSVMTALGAIGVYEGEKLLDLCVLSSSMMFEALCAREQAFFPQVHEVRRHTGQQEIAKKVRQNLEKSTFFGIKAKDILAHFPENLIKNLPKDENNNQNGSQNNLQQQIKDLQKGKILKISDDIFRYLPKEENTPKWLTWATILRFADKKITPQDAYSVRCTPQVMGASLAAIEHTKNAIENELNAVVDNPIIFVEEDLVLSAGNFHGQPIALPLDYLKLAFAEIGNLAERQINKLVDEATNDCLPAFLSEDESGIMSALMIPQYAAASLVSENKVLVHPASADSIPTCANQEDHVSMGTIGGRQALEILENVRKIVAILMLTATQAIDIRTKQLKKAKVATQMGKETKILYDKIRKKVPFIDKDRFLYEDIKVLLDEWKDF